MSPDTILTFDGGYVRILKATDIHSLYVSGLNDPDVNRYLVGVKNSPQTEEGVAEFVTNNESSPNAFLFGIWQTGNPHHCGTIRLHEIESFHRTAHIGICIFDKRVWGKGLGTKAVSCVTKWSFETLNLRWVEAGIYESNIASEKTFISSGYEWMYDVAGKYLFESEPSLVKVYAARSLKW